eukprot:10699504-Ditylum_brightwellii.AAC.1
MKQNTIDETGRIVEKDRLTHDQSCEWSGGKLVNSRVDKDALLPCICKKMLPKETHPINKGGLQVSVSTRSSECGNSNSGLHAASR